jgi:hypothetical protein
MLRHFSLDDAVLWDLARMCMKQISWMSVSTRPRGRGSTRCVGGLSMVIGDDEILAVTGPLFDGLYQYRRRALLLGRDSA